MKTSINKATIILPFSRASEVAGAINLISVFIVNGETVRTRARYIIRSAVQAARRAIQCPVCPARNGQITPSEIEIIQGSPVSSLVILNAPLVMA
jgi:hypothetical protein